MKKVEQFINELKDVINEWELARFSPEKYTHEQIIELWVRVKVATQVLADMGEN